MYFHCQEPDLQLNEPCNLYHIQIFEKPFEILEQQLSFTAWGAPLPTCIFEIAKIMSTKSECPWAVCDLNVENIYAVIWSYFWPRTVKSSQTGIIAEEKSKRLKQSQPTTTKKTHLACKGTFPALDAFQAPMKNVFCEYIWPIISKYRNILTHSFPNN